MSYVREISLFLFLFALAVRPRFVLTYCPDTCQCRGDNNNIVVCTALSVLPVLQGEITQISITGGTISAIPDGYFNISSLESVDLSDNLLTSLNMESFEYTPSIDTITLSDNDILCDENIDWLAMWMASYFTNTVVGTCTGTGATIKEYLNDKPSNLFETSFGTPDALMFGSACDELSINLHIDAPATVPLMYMVTFTAQEPSTADDLQLVSREVTIATGAMSTVIQFRVVNQGSGQDRTYSLSVVPKYFTAELIVREMLLVDDSTECGSGALQTTLSSRTVVSSSVSPPLQSIPPSHNTLSHGPAAQPVVPPTTDNDSPKGATPRKHGEGDVPCTSGELTTTPAAPTDAPVKTNVPVNTESTTTKGVKPSGLSGGAKAAIAILALLLATAGIGALVYVCCCKEDKTPEPTQPDVAYSPVSDKVYNPTTTNDV